MGDIQKLKDMLAEQSLENAKRINTMRKEFANDLRIIRHNVKKLSRTSETERKIAIEEGLVNFLDEQIDGYDKSSR